MGWGVIIVSINKIILHCTYGGGMFPLRIFASRPYDSFGPNPNLLSEYASFKGSQPLRGYFFLALVKKLFYLRQHIDIGTYHVKYFCRQAKSLSFTGLLKYLPTVWLFYCKNWEEENICLIPFPVILRLEKSGGYYA